jgi:hypothetical protein
MDNFRNDQSQILDDTGNPVRFDKKGKIIPRNFWSDGISINEYKVSMLIILLIFWSAIGAFIFIVKGDVTINVVTIITTLGWCVASVNIADRVGNIFNPYSPNNFNGGGFNYYNQNPTTTPTTPINNTTTNSQG